MDVRVSHAPSFRERIPQAVVSGRKEDQAAGPNEGDTAMFVSTNVIGIASPPLFRTFMEPRTVLASRRSRNGSEGWLSLFFRGPSS
jgi:hypothetical protein